jgi:hypothetical protein
MVVQFYLLYGIQVTIALRHHLQESRLPLLDRTDPALIVLHGFSHTGSFSLIIKNTVADYQKVWHTLQIPVYPGYSDYQEYSC